MPGASGCLPQSAQWSSLMHKFRPTLVAPSRTTQTLLGLGLTYACTNGVCPAMHRAVGSVVFSACGTMLGTGGSGAGAGGPGAGGGGGAGGLPQVSLQVAERNVPSGNELEISRQELPKHLKFFPSC